MFGLVGTEGNRVGRVRPVTITGEVSLLWHDRDPYRGDVLLLTLDLDPAQAGAAPDTFEIEGPLALRLGDGALVEGMRVRVECRAETVEVVSPETGETSDEERPVVLDVVVLAA